MERQTGLLAEFSPRSGAGPVSREVYRTQMPVPQRAQSEEVPAVREPTPVIAGAMGEAAVSNVEPTGGGTAPEALLALVRGMAATDLRRAVLFQEVLGPPISERDEDPLGGL